MEYLIFYAIFAITTSTSAMVLLFYPVMVQLEASHPENSLLETPSIAYVVFWLMGILVAPLLFIPVILPKFSEIFQKTLLDTLKTS